MHDLSKPQINKMSFLTVQNCFIYIPNLCEKEVKFKEDCNIIYDANFRALRLICMSSYFSSFVATLCTMYLLFQWLN